MTVVVVVREKMTHHLETYSNVDVRGTVRFLGAKRFTSMEIRRDMNIDSVWAICNVTSSHCEMVPAV